MAIKRIIGRHNEKYRSCLSCGQHMYKALKDNEIYTCGSCEQQHFVDIYQDCIVLTVVEHEDIRRRATAK